MILFFDSIYFYYLMVKYIILEYYNVVQYTVLYSACIFNGENIS
jgi:hypothetical protein